MSQKRWRSGALALLLCSAGCDTPIPGFSVPGFAAPGENTPPIFVAQSLTQTASGDLALTANAIDVDADHLTITYEQIAGPTVIERQSFRIGGTLGATLIVPADGTYAFRIIASDGFFESDVRVSRSVTTPAPPGFDPAGNTGIGTVENPAIGTFDVVLAGGVTDPSGNVSFAQPATVIIEPPPLEYLGTNPLVIRISTTANPTFDTQAIGAIELTSVAPRAGQPDDAFTVTQIGKEVALSGGTVGTPLAGGAAGVFRPGDIASGALQISRIDALLFIDGGTISGTLATLDVTGIVRYEATISGTRR